MHRFTWVGVGVLAAFLGGCGGPNRNLMQCVSAGDYGEARHIARQELSKDANDRNYILGKMRLAVLTLADGYALPQDPSMDQLYKMLRTQDTNKGSEVAETVLWEGVKTWKGEPFEQAMAFHYIGMHYAAQGDWGNARAASVGSLFQLKDFGITKTGSAGEMELLDKNKDNAKFETGYVARDTNFALGYVMAGIANQQLSKTTGDGAAGAEASSYFRKATQVKANLADLCSQLEGGKYNTLLIVDFGQGPQKTRTGPDGAISTFTVATKSDDARLAVSVNNQPRQYPMVCDLNAMATDHKWRNLEDMRKAKSYIGTGLVAAGAGTAMYGAAAGNRDAGYAGLAIMLVGVAMKAAAAADVRYCEVMPQRVYVVPVQVDSPSTRIELQVENNSASKLVLSGLAPPKGSGAMARYVRLNSAPVPNATWPTSGRTFYACDAAMDGGSIALPYILGGTCVSTPTDASLKRYQAAGYLKGMTVSQLQELYRAEGIAWTIQDQKDGLGKHVLEGGNSLVCPSAGTAGFARLIGQQHKPYDAKSDVVKNLSKTLQPQIRPAVASK